MRLSERFAALADLTDEEVRVFLIGAPEYLRMAWSAQWWPCDHGTMACGNCAAPRKRAVLDAISAYRQARGGGKA